LALHVTAARAEELLKERERLLRDVNKKKQQVERARAKAARDAEEAYGKMAPFVARHEELVRELGSLFDELLAAGRLVGRARKQVSKLRDFLVIQGFLAPSDESDEGPLDEDALDEGGEHDRVAEETRAPRDVAGARQPGQERRSLRDIFRNLARAVHPDQARQEPERQHRTEVMKEVTRAYEDGDLARLLELERAWQSERAVADGGSSEARCRELARINRELLNQVRQLTRELRDVKREARDASLGPLDRVVAQAARELDDLESVCVQVRKFRDGKSTLADLVRGL
jgi:hypothetical protein